jgi:ABC-type bacteriocin/lantibiotic exporter with double-glycine peptidase domain
MRPVELLRRPKRVPFIPQMEFTECGAASLAMVMASHGYHAPVSEVRQACDVSRDGASALSIVAAARAYGFEAEGVKVEPEHLSDLPAPVILHWRFRHFLVLESIGRRTATLVDPASGRTKVSHDEIGRNFTGVAIVVVPSPQRRPRPAERPSLARYRSVLRESVPSLVQVLIASLVMQALALAFPVATQVLLDRVIAAGQWSWLGAFLAGLTAAAIARGFLAWLRSSIVFALRASVDWALMTRCLEHLLHVPLGFFLQRRAGDLVDRVQSNTVMRAMFTGTSISALIDGVLLVGYVALMIRYDRSLGGIIIGAAAVRLLVLWYMRERVQRLMSAELAAQGRESGALVDTFAAIETVRASGGEDRMLRRWACAMSQRVNLGLRHRLVSLASGQVTDLLQGISLAAVFAIGGSAVLAGRMTPGVFAAFLTLEGNFLRPLESLLTAVGQLQYLRSHLVRLDDIMNAPREVSAASVAPPLEGAIAFEGVSLRYSESGPFVLQDVSLAVEGGETIAVVGPSGAGKSSLVRLLLGIQRPTEGRVLLDGRDLRDLDLHSVRRQVGVVLQESFLFDDTVRANLSEYDPSIPLERLARAARLACIDDVIDALPQGYDTVLGENGSRLSGGQRQRLCLARALVRDPAILILDEPTSALDLDTEERLRQQMHSLKCTRIVISHRIATVLEADRIAVLSNGRIVQQGSYRGLLEQDGFFRDWVAKRDRRYA